MKSYQLLIIVFIISCSGGKKVSTSNAGSNGASCYEEKTYLVFLPTSVIDCEWNDVVNHVRDGKDEFNKKYKNVSLDSMKKAFVFDFLYDVCRELTYEHWVEIECTNELTKCLDSNSSEWLCDNSYVENGVENSNFPYFEISSLSRDCNPTDLTTCTETPEPGNDNGSYVPILKIN